MNTWVVKEDGGRWSVVHGRFHRDFPTQDDALRYVREQTTRGEKVVMEESDGYRVPLKRPRHWRR
jgi:hypothetical protein